jgi:hypothetical protein
MADDDDTPAPAPADAGLGERVTQLEEGQRSILEKIGDVLGFLQKTPDAPAEPEPEPERPEVNIAQEISRQLAKQRKADAPAAPPKAADLAEKPPVAPVRKLTKMLWGE